MEPTLKEKSLVSIVVIGEQWVGKSLTMGLLIHKAGFITYKEYMEHGMEAAKYGRHTPTHVFLMDRSLEFRMRGTTMDISIRRIETANQLLTILDTPGNPLYLVNKLIGLSLADYAILVIRIDKEGKYILDKSEAIVAFALGIKRIIICLNEFSIPRYIIPEELFNSIRGNILELFMGIGFKGEDIIFIPRTGTIIK